MYAFLLCRICYGMRLCSDRGAQEGGVWGWREDGRRLIGREGRGDRGADEGWMGGSACGIPKE